MMDRAYLESPGWSGIRVRRAESRAMLRERSANCTRRGEPVRILDAACGGGRYVLETLARLRDIPASAVLRDYKQQNLDVAERSARSSDSTA